MDLRAVDHGQCPLHDVAIDYVELEVLSEIPHDIVSIASLVRACPKAEAPRFSRYISRNQGMCVTRFREYSW